jgi:hypothetical protein
MGRLRYDGPEAGQPTATRLANNSTVSARQFAPPPSHYATDPVGKTGHVNHGGKSDSVQMQQSTAVINQASQTPTGGQDSAAQQGTGSQ